MVHTQYLNVCWVCLAKTLSLSENQQFWHNFLNLKICYDYGTCSTSPG